MMTRILQFVQGQFQSQKIQSPNPSYASPFLHKKMYLPLIKLSLVFEFFFEIGFCQRKGGRTGKKTFAKLYEFVYTS